MPKRIGLRILPTSIIISLFFVNPTSAQEQDKVWFKAFGHTPNSISPELYHQLETAKQATERWRLLFSIGKQHVTQGNTDSILHYASVLAQETVDAHDETNTARTYEIMAQWLYGEGNLKNGLLDEALVSYIKGLNKAEAYQDDGFVYNLKIGLAKVYFHKGEIEKASEILLPLQNQLKEGELLSYTNYYLGNIAATKANFEKAKPLFTLVSKNEHHTKLSLAAKLMLANIYGEEKNTNKAYSDFESVMQKALVERYYDIYTEAVTSYGRLMNNNGNHETAELILSIAYTNSIQWNNLELQKKIIQQLVYTYQQKEDFENAYNLMTQYLSVNNQILQKQNTRDLKELEVKYETLQKENQIYQLKEEQVAKQNELKRQKTIKMAILYGFLILLIPIVALLVVYYQKLQTQSQLTQRQQELNEQKLKTLEQEQQLQLAEASLEAQTEERSRIAKQLHDSIGGNLAGIKLQLSNLVSTSRNNSELLKQVNDTYELVRDISHDLTPKKFINSDYVNLIRVYLDNIAKNSSLTISFSAHPNAKINSLPEKLKVEVYQIIQELTTNVLKHAKATSLEVHLNLHQNELQLLFEDDGVGFDTEKHKTGIGLKNLNLRLQNLEASMLLDSALNRGTAITINIPLNAN